MQCKRSWTIAIAVLILLAVATKYVSAKVESQTATQPVGEDVQDIFTFRVRIQNVSPESDVPTLFAPGVWVLHSEAGPLFTSGEADRDQGLEALAEDGDPTALAAYLRAQGLQAGVFDTPVCADTPGLLPSGETVESGDSYEFEVTASAATLIFRSPPCLCSPTTCSLRPPDKESPCSIKMARPSGCRMLPMSCSCGTRGTEANEEPGTGPNQAPASPCQHRPVRSERDVRPVDDESEYPDIADLVRVYIVLVPMVERDQGRQPSPRRTIQSGRNFRSDTCNGVYSPRINSAMNSRTKKATGRQPTSVSSSTFSVSERGQRPIRFRSRRRLAVAR